MKTQNTFPHGEHVLAAVLQLLATDLMVLDRSGRVASWRLGEGREQVSGVFSFACSRDDGPEGVPFLECLRSGQDNRGGTWPPIGRSNEERDLLCTRMADGIGHILYGEGEFFSMEYPVEHDGRVGWHRLQAQPLLSGMGELLGVVVAVLDLSELKTAQEGMRSQRNLFRAMLRSMSDGVVLKDVELRYLAVNPAFAYMLGREEEDLVLARDAEVFEARTARSLEEADRRILEQGGTSYLEISVERGGELRWLHVAKTQVRDGHGRASGVICCMRDITRCRHMEAELKLARKKAEDAAQARTRFLAVMSHEIKNPLAGIIGLAERVMEGGLSREQQNDMRLLRQSVEHLRVLLGDLLDHSELESGKIRLEKRPFRPAQLVQDAIAHFMQQATDKGLALDWEVKPDLPEVMLGDTARIRQILFNLLSNAIKYTDAGSVTLGLHAEDAGNGYRCGEKTLLFVVRDTGRGMAPQDRELLFREYSRVGGVRQRGLPGTGLGLMVSGRLAALMGGAIEVDSMEGQGSTFTLRLPLEPVRKAAAVSGSGSGGAIGSLAVLVADDDAVSRMLARHLLEKLGHSCKEVANGHELLEAMDASDYDLVLADVSMPGMTGLEAVRELRRRERNHVPVVALSGHADRMKENELLSAGMDAVLGKPLDSDLLQHIIMRLCLSSNVYTQECSTAASFVTDTEQGGEMDQILAMDATLKRLHGDREFLGVLYTAFLEDLDERERLLAAAIAARDYEEVMRRAHALKGASHTIDALTVSRLSLELELAAREENEESLDSGMARIHSDLVKVRSAMKEYLDSL